MSRSRNNYSLQIIKFSFILLKFEFYDMLILFSLLKTWKERERFDIISSFLISLKNAFHR